MTGLHLNNVWNQYCCFPAFGWEEDAPKNLLHHGCEVREPGHVVVRGKTIWTHDGVELCLRPCLDFRVRRHCQDECSECGDSLDRTFLSVAGHALQVGDILYQRHQYRPSPRYFGILVRVRRRRHRGCSGARRPPMDSLFPLSVHTLARWSKAIRGDVRAVS